MMGDAGAAGRLLSPWELWSRLRACGGKAKDKEWMDPCHQAGPVPGQGHDHLVPGGDLPILHTH